MQLLDGTIEKITIKDNIASAVNAEGDIVFQTAADGLAAEFFSRTRMPIRISEMSLRWVSQSHLAFIHERPPKLWTCVIGGFRYRIPIPWAIQATVIEKSRRRVALSEIYFAQNQISYPGQDLYFCELPPAMGGVACAKQGINVQVNDPEEVNAISSSSNLFVENARFYASPISTDALEQVIVDAFTDNSGVFNSDKYLEELESLSLKQGLYVQRKKATTLNSLIERLEELDRRVNSEFYEQNNSFDQLLFAMQSLHDKAEMFFEEMHDDEDEEEEDYEPEMHYAEEPEPEEEPF